MKEIKISCSGSEKVNIENLKNFQGELKHLSDENLAKLKKQITDNGFTAPFHVWKHKGELFCIDGHQRLKALLDLQREGYVLPELPIVLIEAKDVKEAKRILLSHASQYGKMEGDDLYEFIFDAEIFAEDIVTNYNFFDLDILEFNEKFFTEASAVTQGEISSEKNEQVSNESAHIKMIQLFLNEQQHEEIMRMCNDLAKNLGTDNVTDTITVCIRKMHEGIKTQD